MAGFSVRDENKGKAELSRTQHHIYLCITYIFVYNIHMLT